MTLICVSQRFSTLPSSDPTLLSVSGPGRQADKMAYMGRSQGLQPHESQGPFFQPSQRGNNFDSFQSGNGAEPHPDMTQSTSTDLVNQFQSLTVDPVKNVLEQLLAEARISVASKPIEGLYLASTNEEYLSIREQNLALQAVLLAALKKFISSIPSATNSIQPIIEHLSQTTKHSAERIVTSQAQITKAKLLADRFKVPMPIIVPKPYGFVRDRELFDIRYINKRMPVFDPDKEPNRCFSEIMWELIAMTEGQYVQEREWLIIFQYILRGEAREELSNCREYNYDLQQTVEYLGILYTRSKTAKESQSQNPDVIMARNSQHPQDSYPDNKPDVDKSAEEKIRELKQRLKEEYEKKMQEKWSNSKSSHKSNSSENSSGPSSIRQPPNELRSILKKSDRQYGQNNSAKSN